MRGRSPSYGSALHGWWHGLVLLLLPFSVFFFETWLQAQILEDGYAINNLNGEIHRTTLRIRELRVEQARLETKSNLDRKALEIGLRKPGPRQIEVIDISSPVYAEMDRDQGREQKLRKSREDTLAQNGPLSARSAVLASATYFRPASQPADNGFPGE